MVEERSDADRRCIELSRLIDGHINHVKNQFPNGLLPMDGSPGAQDLANQLSAPGGSWGPQPVWTLISLASLRLAVARDHLVAMAKTLRPPIPMFGPAALARAWQGDVLNRALRQSCLAKRRCGSSQSYRMSKVGYARLKQGLQRLVDEDG